MTLIYSINRRFLLNKHNNQGANKDCCSPVCAILRQIHESDISLLIHNYSIQGTETMFLFI